MVPGRLEILLTPAALRGQHLQPGTANGGRTEPPLAMSESVGLFKKDGFVDWLVVAANPSEMVNVWLLYG